ncbi:MAG: site-specific DNA-methyltransferase, partial [Treponema sp.]|nr:site-specific DNA-methyltransferase [Treponema sp.]
MNKPRFETADLSAANIGKIAALFPQVITEAIDDEKSTPEKKVYKKAVNFEALKILLGDGACSGNEAYEFTWVGKKASSIEANRPIRKTLRPCKEESRDWDTTQNLYIEGDNLEVLKLLQESYLGKVKMIYIDPPYNTGNDFVYRDKWAVDSEQWSEKIGEYDDETGNRLFRNTESNGRFHSDWCSMIYPRLLLARNLLSDNGVIFISIDDNEAAQLRKICDEVFGEGNFVATINWKGRGGRQDSKYYAIIHEYVLCYARDISNFEAGEEIKNSNNYLKFDKTKQRYYKTQLLRKWGSNSRRDDRPNLFYPITAPDGTELYPMLSANEEGCWRWGQSRMQQELAANNVEFIRSSNTWIAYEKIYAPQNGEDTKKFTTWIDDIGNGTNVIKDIFKNVIFDYTKSPALLLRFLNMSNVKKNDIILDFFSGSATTAHAVMQLNIEDGGNRKFIMVQLPEPCENDSEAFKAGYKNICEIGKERIRRAGNKIKEEAGLNAQNLDIGFRVFKVADSNMKDVYYGAGEYKQENLDFFISNIKEDRTSLDLLYGCLLDWALP